MIFIDRMPKKNVWGPLGLASSNGLLLRVSMQEIPLFTSPVNSHVSEKCQLIGGGRRRRLEASVASHGGF